METGFALSTMEKAFLQQEPAGIPAQTEAISPQSMR